MKQAILLAAAAAALVGAAPAVRPLTCASPVLKTDSAASLKKRFGANARVMKIHVAEGEMERGLALWPDDPRRRIDVFFDDPAMRKIGTIRIIGVGSVWRIGQLGIGSRLGQVVAANGRAVSVSGFGWDYGGGVNAEGGRLARWPGGCRIGLTMDIGPDVSEPSNSVMGDGIMLRSTDPQLKAVRPRVTKIFIDWLDPRK